MDAALKWLVKILRKLGVAERHTHFLVVPVCALVIFAGVYKALHELGVADPWSAVIAGGLLACAGWLTLGAWLSRDQHIAFMVLAVVSLPFIAVLCAIWYLAGWTSFRVPLLAGAAFMGAVGLLERYWRRALPNAAQIGGALFLGLLALLLGQYSEYLSPTPPNRVGVWIARYDLDADGKGRAGVVAQLEKELGGDPSLRSVVEVRDLRRPVPGNSDTDRFAHARKLGERVNAALVVFGTMTARGVSTKIAVIHKLTGFADAEVTTLVTDLTFPAIDVQTSYLLAKTIAALIDLNIGSCTIAEQRFLEVQHTRDVPDLASVVPLESLRLFTARSIICQAESAVNGADRLRDAAAVYESLLKTSNARIRTLALGGLGITHRRLAGYNHPIENLHKAIAAYSDALKVIPPEAEREFGGAITSNLGVAYEKLAEHENAVVNLKLAIATHQRALAAIDRVADPVYYALTQNNIGVAYQHLAPSEDRIANLRRAIDAYRTGLSTLGSEREPARRTVRMAKGRIESNLGDVYGELALYEDAPGNLRRAEAALRDALRDAPRATAPAIFAESHYHLGSVYMMRAHGAEHPEVPRGVASLACSLVILDGLHLSLARVAANDLRKLRDAADKAGGQGTFTGLLASAPAPDDCAFRPEQVVTLIDKWSAASQ